MSDYTCAVRKVTQLAINRNGGVTHVTFHPFKGSDESRVNGGTLTIDGDFGPFSHTWTHIGGGDFVDFLESLSFDYAMNKLSPERIEQFDGDKTRGLIKQAIIERRKDGEITAPQARHFWDEVDHLDLDSEHDAYRDLCDVEWSGVEPDGDRLYQHLTLLDGVFGGDPTAIPFGTSTRGNLEYFWNEVWPIILVEMRKAIDAEKLEVTA